MTRNERAMAESVIDVMGDRVGLGFLPKDDAHRTCKHIFDVWRHRGLMTRDAWEEFTVEASARFTGARKFI